MNDERHNTKRLYSMVNDIDPCSGSISKNVLYYAWPVLGTSLLQLAFNAADLIVVGRFRGSNSIAAIGATTSAIHLLVNCFIGLSTGAGVIISQACGAKNQERIFSTIQTSIPLAMITGLLLGIIGNVAVSPILSQMNVPESIANLSEQYMRIIFCGSVFNLLYNFASSILRSTGDSQRPMLYLIVSGIVNVVLNLFCVLVLKLNVSGVAWATVASQALSAALTISRLYRKYEFRRLKKKLIKFNKLLSVSILKIGFPVSVQSMTFAMANVVVQSAINGFGSDAISGSAAAANIEAFVCTGMSALQQTVVVFVGQNYGAGNSKRVLESLKVCRNDALILTLVASVITLLCSRQLLGIYISDSATAIEMGSIRLKYIVSGYALCAIVYVSNGFLQGLGNTIWPMAISLLGICGFRIIWMLTVFHIPRFHDVHGLFCVFPISYLLTGLMLCFMVCTQIRKIQTEDCKL